MARQSTSKSTSDFRRIWELARPHLGALSVATLSLFVAAGIGLAYPKAAQYVIDQVLVARSPVEARSIGLILLGLFLVQALFVGLRYYLFTVVGERIVTDLRQKLFGAILAQEMGFFDESRTGELTSRLASDTQSLQTAVTSNLSMLLRNGVQALGGVIIMVLTAWKLSLIMLVALVLMLGFAVGYGRVLRKLSRRVQDALAHANSVAEESLAGIRTVRGFAREREEIRRYGEATEESFRIAQYRAKLGSFFGGGISFLGYGTIALILWLGSTFVLSGQMTPGELTAFILYTLIVSFALGVLSGLYTDLMKAVGASDRVFGLIDRVPDISRVENPVVEPPKIGRVALEQVHFSYPSRPDTPALNNVSLQLRPGERVALVGPSGSGKSTVANLVLRLYDPNGGSVRIDGLDIRTWDPDALREAIGIVSQEPMLFSGTIRDNLHFGRLNASDAEMIEALKAAHAWEFIATFPEQLDAVVGERGVRLSGGQKQRLAIARALLRDPRILILDEATSALDVESEALVQKALERLMEGRTTLIIAHRLSTIQNADRVVVLEKGEVRESGTHAELMAHQDRYFRLVESQQVLR